MGMLRQLGRLQVAATGPPRWVFDPKPDPCSRALETIMISTIETGPAEAGAIAFRPHPAHAHRAILSLDLGTTTGWALRSHDGLITSGTVSFRTIAYQGVPVGTIKRHVAAKGNADKAAVMAAVRARGFSPADDNEADAIAILLWAIETDGGVR